MIPLVRAVSLKIRLNSISRNYLQGLQEHLEISYSLNDLDFSESYFTESDFIHRLHLSNGTTSSNV